MTWGVGRERGCWLLAMPSQCDLPRKIAHTTPHLFQWEEEKEEEKAKMDLSTATSPHFTSAFL